MNAATRLPTLFISHGGGPWPYIDDMKTQFAKTAQWLTALPATLPCKPKAILCISGHWEENILSVSSSAHPPMVYDYSGFPEHTYHIQYKAPGAPALAAKVQQLLSKNGFENAADENQGFDHGTFVPLVLMYPDANIPVVQLSLQRKLDPLLHIRVGTALQSLRDEGVLIIGSGLSYHNLRAFGPAASPVADAFEQWLSRTVEIQNADERNQHLVQWAAEAPQARMAHPREDHLIPLMVAAGAAGDDLGRRIFIDKVWGISMSSYQFGS